MAGDHGKERTAGRQIAAAIREIRGRSSFSARNPSSTIEGQRCALKKSPGPFAFLPTARPVDASAATAGRCEFRGMSAAPDIKSAPPARQSERYSDIKLRRRKRRLEPRRCARLPIPSPMPCYKAESSGSSNHSGGGGYRFARDSNWASVKDSKRCRASDDVSQFQAQDRACSTASRNSLA